MNINIRQCSSFGVGSIVKYDGSAQRLLDSRFVAAVCV